MIINELKVSASFVTKWPALYKRGTWKTINEKLKGYKGVLWAGACVEEEATVNDVEGKVMCITEIQ